MSTLHLLPEPDHRGLLIVDDDLAIALDPPLELVGLRAALGEASLVAVIETSVPTWRMSGARRLSEQVGAPLYSIDGAVDPSQPLVSSMPFALFAEIGVRTLSGVAHAAVTVNNASTVWVGSLDVTDGAPAAEARRRLADEFPNAQFSGSSFDGEAEMFAELDPPGHDGLNAEAIEMTNRGQVDMYWADPRFVDEVEPATIDYLHRRLESRRPPTVIDLRRDPSVTVPAVHLPPERLASSFTSLAGEDEIIVIADSDGLAARAAGFLHRLGIRGAAWVPAPTEQR